MDRHRTYTDMKSASAPCTRNLCAWWLAVCYYAPKYSLVNRTPRILLGAGWVCWYPTTPGGSMGARSCNLRRARSIRLAAKIIPGIPSTHSYPTISIDLPLCYTSIYPSPILNGIRATVPMSTDIVGIYRDTANRIIQILFGVQVSSYPTTARHRSIIALATLVNSRNLDSRASVVKREFVLYFYFFFIRTL